ncbi:MAG: hypothetical protein WKG01_17385 [Kofleriaceae bacterium]
MDLQEIQLSVMKVVDVTPGLPHEDPLDQIASRSTVMLSDRRRGAQLFEGLLELFEEEITALAILSPPLVRLILRRASSSRTIFTTCSVFGEICAGVGHAASFRVIQRSVE